MIYKSLCWVILAHNVSGDIHEKPLRSHCDRRTERVRLDHRRFKQSLSVKTVAGGADVAGSQCSLTNDKGTWFVITPGTVTVHRNYDAIKVKCEHDGYVANTASTNSATKCAAFSNILFGGLIGAGVDMSTGAAYDYPNPIVVPLTPGKTAKSDGAPTS
jgi:hypothetical protein